MFSRYIWSTTHLVMTFKGLSMPLKTCIMEEKASDVLYLCWMNDREYNNILVLLPKYSFQPPDNVLNT